MQSARVALTLGDAVPTAHRLHVLADRDVAQDANHLLIGESRFSHEIPAALRRQTRRPFLYLNTTNNPNTGQPIRIASLRGKSGAQRFTFTVPAGVRYTWLVIWCDPFNIPMAEAAITPVP